MTSRSIGDVTGAGSVPGQVKIFSVSGVFVQLNLKIEIFLVGDEVEPALDLPRVGVPITFATRTPGANARSAIVRGQR